MVTQETEYSHTPTVRLGFFFFFFFFLAATNGDLVFFFFFSGTMVEERFVLTIETEHSQHINAIFFFFWFFFLFFINVWRQPGTMVEEQCRESDGDKRKDKGIEHQT